jgi:hypothetical protein
VIGAVYDFTNALHHGDGRIVIVNINGDNNQERVAHRLSGLLQVQDKLSKQHP